MFGDTSISLHYLVVALLQTGIGSRGGDAGGSGDTTISKKASYLFK